jgi:hypothetical protein
MRQLWPSHVSAIARAAEFKEKPTAMHELPDCAPRYHPNINLMAYDDA